MRALSPNPARTRSQLGSRKGREAALTQPNGRRAYRGAMAEPTSPDPRWFDSVCRPKRVPLEVVQIVQLARDNPQYTTQAIDEYLQEDAHASESVAVFAIRGIPLEVRCVQEKLERDTRRCAKKRNGAWHGRVPRRTKSLNGQFASHRAHGDMKKPLQHQRACKMK